MNNTEFDLGDLEELQKYKYDLSSEINDMIFEYGKNTGFSELDNAINDLCSDTCEMPLNYGTYPIKEFDCKAIDIKNLFVNGTISALEKVDYGYNWNDYKLDEIPQRLIQICNDYNIEPVLKEIEINKGI